MRIGIVIGRIGGVDGVALETEKWAAVLRRLGHDVDILTGELEANVAGCTVLPELAFSHPATLREQDDAFFVQQADEAELMERLHADAASIARDVLAWLSHRRIDVLITQNCTTLPCHLTMGMALKRGDRADGDPDDRPRPRLPLGTRRPLHESIPGRSRRDRRVLSTRPAQPHPRGDQLRMPGRTSRTLGIEAQVVPNVMDFEGDFGKLDDFNRRLPDELGWGADDIVLFQITRVVRRKGIETAIELVDRLDDPRIRLIVTGHATDDYQGEYLSELRARAACLSRPEQVQFAADRFANLRVSANGAPAKFSLSDGYASAHACTYFSKYEGFGNAFVEAIAARVPIFVNNYEPVYLARHRLVGLPYRPDREQRAHRPGSRGHPQRAHRSGPPRRHRRAQLRDRPPSLLV